MAAGRLEQARSVLSRALARDPAAAPEMDLLAATLMRMGLMDQARFYAERACALRPTDPAAHFNLGKLSLSIGQNEPGIASLERAVALEPDERSTFSALTNALIVGQRFAEGERLARQGLERWPDDAELLVDLASALQASGRAREAVPIFRRATGLYPDDAMAATLYAACVNYAGDVEPRDALEAHLSYGRLVDRSFGPAREPPRTDPDPDRRLRLGVLSGDLRAHAVGFFIEPLLAHHDRTTLEIACFSTATMEDATSARLRGMSRAWHAVAPLTFEQLADKVRRERIDILVELSGHTGGHRLPVFQLRPAPIGATYFGYPNTTGVRAVDYRIVDSITDPVEPWYDALAAERLWRLDPCFLCYQGHPQAPEPAPPPSAGGVPFTFGTFNNLSKHDDLALDLYRRVLEAVPGSRLMLKYGGLGSPGVRQIVIERFGDAGIEPARLVLEGPGRTALETLPAYARMDVMLDSFPYHGTTTTCEALYMGVPVVSLQGRVCAARVGGSILTNVGLPELIASTPEHYVQIAAGLAADPSRLAAIRSGLRTRMLASPVCDGPGFARRFESALRGMWREWCRGPAGPAPA